MNCVCNHFFVVSVRNAPTTFTWLAQSVPLVTGLFLYLYIYIYINKSQYRYGYTLFFSLIFVTILVMRVTLRNSWLKWMLLVYSSVTANFLTVTEFILCHVIIITPKSQKSASNSDRKPKHDPHHHHHHPLMRSCLLENKQWIHYKLQKQQNILFLFCLFLFFKSPKTKVSCLFLPKDFFYWVESEEGSVWQQTAKKKLVIWLNFSCLRELKKKKKKKHLFQLMMQSKQKKVSATCKEIKEQVWFFSLFLFLFWPLFQNKPLRKRINIFFSLMSWIHFISV